MINFDYLEANKETFREQYLLAKPFSHLIVDDFCDEEKILKMRNQIPELDNKSRDYVFANNKFEKSNYKELGPLFNELYEDLRSDRMNQFLKFVVNQDVFVDPKNHGGGLHQGKKNSFLDMHLDFNYHPLEEKWFRQVNILLYLNKEWKEEYGGHLKIEDLRTGEKEEISVPFNRVIIQECAPYTLHGYDMTSFPEGNFRTSVATYGYVKHLTYLETPRTTDWFPDKGSDPSSFKTLLSKNYNALVQIKNKLLGSGTAKNQ